MTYIPRGLGGNLGVKAAANLPQSASGVLFTIATGKIVVNTIYGEVTTIVQATANNAKLTYTPTLGGAPADLCAVLDITGSPVGTLWTITGVPANALVAGQQVARNDLGNGLVLGPGTVNLSCSASATGQARWAIYWAAIDPGATLT